MNLYEIREPQGEETPLVVSIPHTGEFVPEAIAATFASDHIGSLPNTDWHLHQLYDFLPEFGATTLYATHHRLVVDLNRPPAGGALYPGRFETELVALKTFQGEDVYAEPPDAAEVEARRARYHAPYHERLQALLNAKRERFGQVFLIDAHSVASRPSLFHGELEEDIYLGNRDGGSCEDWFIGAVEGLFDSFGFGVVRNDPFKGGYITDHYGQQPGVQALQIEMVQRLYMDEDHPAGAPQIQRFADTREALRSIFERLTRILRDAPVER